MESATLRIRLLGQLDLRHGDATLPPLESARAGSLLAYLLLHRDAPQPRQRIAFLLWPDSTEPQARTNLRHVLHTLRRALPEPDRFLEVTPRTLRWRPDAPFWLDVAAFEQAVARSEEQAAEDGLASLRRAVGLYRGDLLDDSDEEWLLEDRERLRNACLQALERLVRLLDEHGHPADAIPYAERLLRHDPLHEGTYRLLMRLHGGAGDRVRALRVYHACAATLERELGVEPSAATRQAYEALLPPAGRPAAVGGATGRAGRFSGPPLIGRAPEWTRLTALWRAAERGGARLLLVTGEAGIGKTRLVEELRSWCAHRGALTAESRSYRAEGALAYGPVVAWLRSEVLREHVQRLDQARLGELTRLLPELRAARRDHGHPSPSPDGDRRRLLFDALAGAVLASGGPVLLVADDLHWADRETLQFLHYLLRAEPHARLLVAATARSEELDPGHPLHDLRTGLQALERCTEIELGRLSRPETAVIAERFAGSPLAEPEADRLFADTEGNPLFVIEALRAGWRSGRSERSSMSPKVRAVIESRLGQLSEPARDVVAVAATIGREFTTSVLAAASEVDEGALVHGLDELWQRRIIRDLGPDAYDFTHDKLREVAYLRLSPARRRHHHLRVAHALELLYAGDAGPVSAQLAAHHDRAGAPREAAVWYKRAAEVAQQLHADAEAVRLLDRALALVGELPSGRERNERELAILTALQAPLSGVGGWASDRLDQVQQRGLELARVLQVEPDAPLLRSLAVASLARGDFGTAQRVAAQLHAGGERDADDVRVVEGRYVLGIAAFWKGELDSARRHFEAAVDRYRPGQRHVHLLRYGLDPKVICLSRLANTLWFLGRPSAAERARDAALALAGEIDHPPSRAVTLIFAAMLALELREPALLRRHVAALAAGPAQHMRPSQVHAEGLGGYIDVLNGAVEAGFARIQRALQTSREAQHAPGLYASQLRVLLEACAVAGDARAGLAATDLALATAGSVRLWEAELRRLRAEFLITLGAPAEESEAELHRALSVARRQGARMLELRAAVSLLRHGPGGRDGRTADPARDRLAAIVAALPEGRDTRELREAAAVLAAG